MRFQRMTLRYAELWFAALALTVFSNSAEAQRHVRLPPGRSLSPGHTATRALAADSVHMLALMVEFLEDDDSRTVGRGSFDTTVIEGRGVDPPPHDRSFFQLKMQFVENYFRKVSNGKVSVTGDILPSTIRVSGTISDYSLDNTPANKGLALLAVEAWSIADTTFPSVDFSAYDAFVIFHAGAGKDIDLVGIYGFDPSPYDLPSLYLGIGTFRQALGDPSYAGIPVRGGSFRITNSMLLPETESRIISDASGTDTIWISFNGLFAASVGSLFGLPDLFNTSTGASAIGQHGLMDGASIFSFFGLFPPEPNAWEKAYLGWVDPITVSPAGGSITIPAVGLTAAEDSVYKVPITATEYFLVENRIRDPLGDGQRLTVSRNGVSSIVYVPRDSLGFFSFESIDGINGSVTDVEDFDWALIGYDGAEIEYVGGGVLIWHVDERVIAEGLATNTVNADPDRRGIDLEEADGPQDIGQTYDGFSGGSGSEIGNPLDCWYAENVSEVYTNSFSSATFPDSRANSGAASLVTIHSFSPRSPRMTAVVQFGSSLATPLAGFPKRLQGVLEHPVAYDMNGDSFSEFFATQTLYSGPDGRTGTPVGNGRLLGWNSSGASLFLPSDSGGIIAEVSSPSIGSPVFFAAGGRHFASAATGDRLHVWYLEDTDANGRLDTIYTFSLSASSTPWSLAVVDSYIVAYGSSGINVTTLTGAQVFSDSPPYVVGGVGIPGSILGGRGTSLRVLSFSSVGSGQTIDLNAQVRIIVGGTDADGKSMTAVLAGDSPSSLRVHVFDVDGASLTPSGDFPMRGYDPNADGDVAELSFADLDQNGTVDLIISCQSGRQLAYSSFGIPLEGFPRETRNSSVHFGSRLLRNISTGSAEVIVADSSGVVHFLTVDGSASAQLGDASGSGLALGTIADGGNPALGLFLVQSAGMAGLWSREGPVSAQDFLWPVEGGNPSRNNLSPVVTPLPVPLANGFLPPDRTYNWPNPVYGTETFIRFFSEEDGSAQVDIFDMAGDRIVQLHGEARGGEDSEIRWDVSSVQSGVYLARVQLNAAGRVSTRVIKVAVVH